MRILSESVDEADSTHSMRELMFSDGLDGEEDEAACEYMRMSICSMVLTSFLPSIYGSGSGPYPSMPLV